MIRQIQRQFYKAEDDGAGSGAPEVTEDGTVNETKTEEAKPEPKFVTEDALGAFADRIIAGLAPQQQQEYFDPTITEDDLIDVNTLNAKLAARDQWLVQSMKAEQSNSLSVTDAVELIGDDLDKDARAHLKATLSEMEPATRKMAVENPKSRQMLLDSAEMASIRKNRTVAVPGSREPSNTDRAEGFDGISGSGIKQIEQAMKAFNLTKKDAIASYREGLK